MSSVLFWVRDRARHAPAHIITRWNHRQAVLMCGNWTAQGGHIITRTEAIQQQVHVCIGCARVLGGNHADIETLYAQHLGGSR